MEVEEKCWAEEGEVRIYTLRSRYVPRSRQEKNWFYAEFQRRLRNRSIRRVAWGGCVCMEVKANGCLAGSVLEGFISWGDGTRRCVSNSPFYRQIPIRIVILALVM